MFHIFGESEESIYDNHLINLVKVRWVPAQKNWLYLTGSNGANYQVPKPCFWASDRVIGLCYAIIVFDLWVEGFTVMG